MSRRGGSVSARRPRKRHKQDSVLCFLAVLLGVVGMEWNLLHSSSGTWLSFPCDQSPGVTGVPFFRRFPAQ